MITKKKTECVFFFTQKTAYEIYQCDWSSDVCSSDLLSLKEPNANATVTQCHTGTRDLPSYTKDADILVVAVGRAGFVTPDMVKPGAAVLDVGITRTEAGLVGDVAPEVREVAGHLAPMPGGVGPMTIALLLRNAVEAAERRAGI